MAGRFLSLFKPLGRILPEIKKPERKVKFNEKLFWTAIVLIVFFIMSEIPLWGASSDIGGEYNALRVIFASNRGTLMELGIGPIVTAGLILQLLSGSSLIKCDMSNPQDRGLFTIASKVFSIVLTGVQGGAYLLAGMYGSIAEIGAIAAVVIFFQLIVVGVFVILLDELLQKGWGLGSGISLFIMAGVAQNILWMCFSPGYGLFTTELSWVLAGSTDYTLYHWIFGTGAAGYATLVGLIATIGTFLVTIYLNGVRIELPMSYAGYKGFRSKYPIKLLYVSNLPVIFASALFANVYFFGQLLWSSINPNNSNAWLNWFGTFNNTNGTITPTGGLV
ncbi:MAG: preprotein translocase subunit SecY, partial [Crenarchaeota archaeon]|nr:preprotein translocase subunit SecY [Thermoproteota archaeon]